MMCAWDKLLAVLPPGIRKELTEEDRRTLRELRLRLGQPPERSRGREDLFSGEPVRAEDIAYVINAASRYSPWAVSTVKQGYITLEGGHRMGLAGQAGSRAGFQRVDSLCIRIARDIPGAAKNYAALKGSTLILGAPGWGKTTLLRDLCRQRSETCATAVIDERLELFPPGFVRGRRMDVLSGCSKEKGLEMALRTLSPQVMAVDEITAKEDCQALIYAASCGVELLATAHAASREDLYKRDIYRPLMERKIFDNFLILDQHQKSSLERMAPCN